MSAWGNSWSSSWGSSWGFEAGIINLDATTDVPVNYVICDRTGFKMYARGHGSGVKEYYGSLVRPKSYEPKHPQDDIGSHGPDNHKGPKRPEANDVFLAVNEVKAADL